MPLGDAVHLHPMLLLLLLLLLFTYDADSIAAS